MPEENKIDYTGIQIPDIESVRKTAQQFTDWRRSMGFQTEEEKNAALKAEMQAAQQRFNDQDLWNSEDPYEVYNTYETDPAKQAEFQRNGQIVAGVGSTIATLPFTAGMMGGWTPAIVSTAAGAAGGQAGAYGGQKLGQYLDDKYGTNLTPGLTFAGGLVGGTLGGGIGYKGWEGATNQYIINKAFKSGQLKWGNPTSYTAYHQSATPITKFKFPFKERWDVRTHGADPNGAFFTVGKPAGSGFLAERPYTGQFQVKVQKPLIQTGELTGPTKNGLRNAIVRRARKNGADAVFFDGIADNQLQNQQILFAMDNADISFTGGPGKVRYFGPTMGKTTLVKTNNNYVDLDQLVKPLRKQIAEQLGLKVSDPRVAKSPEYQTALKQLVEEFQTNTANAGKTLVGSQKQLLNGDFVLDGEPMLPDFETFVARNQSRGFKETPEQLRVWYDEILGLKPDIKVDNRYVSEIVYGKPSKLTLAERVGIPKGERNNGKILLSMQDLVPSKFTSVPGLKPVGGKMIADKVVNHPHILDRTRRLQQTYKRMIDPDYVPTTNWRKNRGDSPGMKIVDDIDVDITHTNSPTSTTENIGGYYNPSEDIVYVRRRGTPDAQASTAFHEDLHGYDFGRDEINDWIIKHLIDPEKVKGMSPRAQKYYLGSQEAPVHALQHGFIKGLDIGAPYPGDAAFDELLDSGIGGSLYYFKTQTPKDKRRLWRAMTGDLFVKKQGGKIENPDH